MPCVSVPHPGLLKESLESPGTTSGEAEHTTTLLVRLPPQIPHLCKEGWECGVICGVWLSHPKKRTGLIFVAE